MIKYLVASIVGAIIGYITNWLAIKMLFRPYNEVRVFGIKMPFTPGLIPKEQKRIAKSVGETIGTHLLSTEILVEALSNDKVKLGVEGWTKQKIEGLCNSEITIGQVLSKIKPEFSKEIEIKLQHISREKFGEILRQKIKEEINGQKTVKDFMGDNVKLSIKNYINDEKSNIAFNISKLIKEPTLANKIKGMVEEGVSNNVNPLMAMFINPDSIYNKAITVIDSQLLKEDTQLDIAIFLSSLVDRLDYVEVRSLLKGVGHDDIELIIGKLSKDLHCGITTMWLDICNLKIKGILENKKDIIESFASNMVQIMSQNFIKNEAGKVIELLDIEKIVENQINSFPVDFAEEIIVSIANKELKAITWLGALLGGILGILSPLLSALY